MELQVHMLMRIRTMRGSLRGEGDARFCVGRFVSRMVMVDGWASREFAYTVEFHQRIICDGYVT